MESKNKMEKKKNGIQNNIVFLIKDYNGFEISFSFPFYKFVKKLRDVNLIWIQNLGVLLFNNIKA
jgi:hypothetical protein